MKRGQLLSQPFIMLFAIIVGALVLAWGVYEINKLMNLSEDVQLTDTVSNLQKVVDQYYYFNEGSSKEYKIILPSKFDKICFYSSGLGWNPSDSDLNREFMEARENDNVFIFPIADGSVFNVANIETEGRNPLCFKSGEAFTITSRDTHVEVSQK